MISGGSFCELINKAYFFIEIGGGFVDGGHVFEELVSEQVDIFEPEGREVDAVEGGGEDRVVLVGVQFL